MAGRLRREPACALVSGSFLLLIRLAIVVTVSTTTMTSNDRFVLIAIGSTDILFALDSIPAVFGVTAEPYIVFVANAFALLGLRALFFLVKGLLDRLVYLSTGLAIILAFIGVKLILHWAHGIWPGAPEISTNLSLLVIVVVLVITTVASLIKSRYDAGQQPAVNDAELEPADAVDR